MSESRVDAAISSDQRETAKRIRNEVIRGPKGGLFAKATTLLHAFKHDGRSAGMQLVQDVLAEYELIIDPPASHHQTTGVVRISAAATSEETTPLVRKTLWNADTFGTSFDEADAPVGGGYVHWYDIDPVAEEHIQGRAESLTAKIQDHCRGLQPEMIKKLLEEDPQPRVETFGNDDGDVRGVSIFTVIARESEDSGTAQQLIFQTVELLVGRAWIVSCWHAPKTLNWPQDQTTLSHDPALLKEPFVSHVRYLWGLDSTKASSVAKSAGDLGIYLARALVDTYGATSRMMERWLSHWEVEFSRALSESVTGSDFDTQQAQISSYLHMSSEIHRRLTALKHAQHATHDQTWFPGVTETEHAEAEGTRSLNQISKLKQGVNSALNNFQGFKDDIRTNVNQLILQSSTSLQHSSAKLQESSSRVQDYLALITGLVLVPTLVVGLFGANTRLPGGGTWLGFELMIALMAASGMVVLLLIKRLKRKQM